MTILCDHFIAPVQALQPDLVARIASTLRVWRERQKARAELAGWDERDLRDAGLSKYDIQFEANKPFWRA